MQKLRFHLFTLFILTAIVTNAQYSVNGRIVDSASKEPLSGASVYCQNTTVGTVTNKDGRFSLDLKSGGYEMVISFTGYQTKQIRISQADNTIPDIDMIKEDKSLGEVIIKSSNEVKDGWAKYGSFFVDHFIGRTPFASQTSLTNPEVLKFYFLKKSNKLRVLATEPLLIENKALGYNLRYQLDSFVYFYNTDINSYRGYCLYSEMEGTDSLKAVWEKRRQASYYGSKLHFMRSYYDSTLLEEGFLLDMLSETSDTKFERVSNPYDTLYYGALDSTLQIEIWYPRKLSIAYTKKKPESEFLKEFKLPKNVAVQLSYIEMKDGIAIKENGYYYDQKDWINQGYWSWKNLADQLPYDYTP